MSSNSIRIEAGLFDAARGAGALMSRSAAQQIEYWARVGAALESCGLTVAEVAELLRAHAGAGGAADAELWQFKRERQKADLRSARSGRVSQEQLSWFSGGKARRLELIGSPY